MPVVPGRTGYWQLTHTGNRFWPADPRPEEVLLEDVAHALAYQCRFAGHTRNHYSVAQHCVLVSEMCDPRDALSGLLHDAAEAYVVDVPRPVKKLPELAGYLEIEGRVFRAIAARFGIPAELPASVHRADGLIALAEMRDLLPAMRPEWDDQNLVNGRNTAEAMALPEVKPWPAAYAKEQYLRRFAELTRGLA